MVQRYVGRFAPSPTGPLHAGSLVAALASWLDARAHAGRWLVRIEDVDVPRTVAGASAQILQQLAACGLVPDERPWTQSGRTDHYQAALDRLIAGGQAYPCHCSRKDIEAAWAARGITRMRHGELAYPGTCRPDALHTVAGQGGTAPRGTAWRLRVPPGEVHWQDRRLGAQSQDVSQAIGDFVLRRADGWFAYQLAVVVDDAAQDVTHVVRGADLADNTARQILLQTALGLPTPSYLHVPIVCNAAGEKLSKQSGAPALDTSDPVALLQRAAQTLDLPDLGRGARDEWLAQAVSAWRERWGPCAVEESADKIGR